MTKPGQVLDESDDLSTGPDSTVTMTFSDGSVINVRPLTQISLASASKQKDNVKVRLNLKMPDAAVP